ncbi:type II toxin-antitoxin system VapB family antitoxin [Kitasatospora purpeofusca]|uniref:type II toxin-antitoxin system VapB family antitoxin n=1 Tax=Kitasatospora purpeofusca TaxID=67352 RepID=UPI0022567BC4|nr:type II toxin-antitoxin system VapB family antitoxin [Kitasatospora purpeofusca]MCX4756704.1 type II toxin-antitoxin system VapB family antitoxin [Kitasatospora purpeofusca]WSR35504.1 type II toxin-antitoxin system VapB family antitoxin [Kitasatospora purpeofusca]WSR43823.1 type II toxin-antitoxin system VapB family antitoxin [Kitasatospora purpeofusca]
MARTETDVDDTLRVEEAETFGTTTGAATVDAAPEGAAERRKGREFLDRLAEGGLPELTGPVGTGG